MLMHSRELCDQCSTTIFNGHMACKSCGFVVCIDCFNLRTRNHKSSSKIVKVNLNLIFLFFYNEEKLNKKDQFLWLFCYKYDFKLNRLTKKPHWPVDLIYVQFIPSKSIFFIFK